jgi:acyl-CoA thioester hydrolase
MLDYRFLHPVEVRYADLDPQGHLNNAKYLTYFEQARLYYWREVGLFPGDQSFTESGVIIADVHISYEAPVFWGEPIKVGVRTVDIGEKSFTVEQCVLNGSLKRVHATGTVVLVAYDYSKRETMRVPDEWRDRLRRYEGPDLA